MNYSNVAVETTLSGGATSGATSIGVTATTGFPSPDFTLVIDPGTASEELVLVTAVGGTTLTVTRGHDGTTASSHDAGAVVRHVHSAKDFKDSRDHEAATAAHGATGAVVGTTNTQTLTNKTLTDPTVTGLTLDGKSVSGAWTGFTPTLTAGSGTIGSASATGRYQQVGKAVHWSMTVTISSIGTASGALLFTLPVTARASADHIGTGSDVAFEGAMIARLSSATQGQARRFDGSSIFNEGVGTLLLSGTYEAA